MTLSTIDCFLSENHYGREFSLVTMKCVFLMMGKYLHDTGKPWVSAGTCPSPMTHKTHRTKFLLNLCPSHNGQFFVSGRALEPVHFLAQFGNVKNKLAMVKKGRKKVFDVWAMPIYTDYFSKMGFPYYILLPPTTAYYRLLHLQTGPRPSLRLLWAV